MNDSIKLDSLSGYELELAKLCDHNNDKVLTDSEDYQEVSIFNKAKEDIQNNDGCVIDGNYFIKIDNLIHLVFSKEIFEELKNNFKNFCIEKTDASNAIKPATAENFDFKSMRVRSTIITECERRKLNTDKVDVDYWCDVINHISNEYNIPPEILVAIVAREVRFVKQEHGGGAMQLTPIATKDIYPSSGNAWAEVYELLDEKLYNDIIYETKENGEKTLRHSSSAQIRTQCSKDDEFSLKVGTLLLKMLYVKAIAKKKYGKATTETIKKAILEIRDGNLKLTEDEEMECLSNAIQRYNNNTTVKKGVKICIDYRRDVIDSLKTQKYDFNNIPMISS